MEKGSLLEEALFRSAASATASTGSNGRQQQPRSNDDSNTCNNIATGGSNSNSNNANSNILSIDVFLLSSSSSSNDNNKEETFTTTTNQHQQRNHIILDLASIAKDLNDYISSASSRKQPLWHYGGDGPIFGVCVSDGIVHLRAELWYGYDSNNEFIIIDLLVKWSSSPHKTTSCHNKIAISCWDISDNAPLLMIEFASILPDWVDDSELENLDDQYLNSITATTAPQRHRYTCWILCGNNGQVKLLKNSGNISLQAALTALSSSSSSSSQKQKDDIDNKIITTALSNHLKSIRGSDMNRPQRTPMILPRNIHNLFNEKSQNQPNNLMIHTAIQSYCEYQQQQAMPVQKLDLKHYVDWVWTIQSISKTNYAMLRTIDVVVGDDANGSTSDSNEKEDGGKNTATSLLSSTNNNMIPSNWSVNVEVKRYQRKFASGGEDNMTPPHLQHAVLCGLKVVAGIEYMIQVSKIMQNGLLLNYRTIYEIPPSSSQERIENWIQLLSSVCDGQDPSSWLLESYQQGPNKSKVDLTHILKCPVFMKEQGFLTLHSNPNQSLIQQIKSGMKIQCADDDEQDDYPIPSSDEVDDTKWLEEMLTAKRVPGDNEQSNLPNEEDKATLDKMLSKFQNFVINDDDGENGGGDHHGIDESTTQQLKKEEQDGQQGSMGNEDDDNNDRSPASKTTTSNSIATIRPRIVLNILHSILKGDDDLILFPPTTKEEQIDDDDDAKQHDSEMENLMAAMDEELQGRIKLSRRLDGMQIVEEADSAAAILTTTTTTTTAPVVENKKGDNIGDTASSSTGGDESSHVLLNLLKSLEASGGNPGPVPNTMKEMGAEIPKL